jgi:hypothetical protein
MSQNLLFWLRQASFAPITARRSSGCYVDFSRAFSEFYFLDYTGENQNQDGAYLAIVLRVEDVDGNGEIEPGEVWLIESNATLFEGQIFGSVFASRVLSTEGIASRNWVIMRLK